MTSKNLQNHVATTPRTLDGDITMSQTESPTQPASISEMEFAVRLGLGTRAIFNRRKSGKLPPHFYAPHPTGPKQQIRYWLADVIAHEQNQTA
jgi:hypothetical protein